MAGLKNDLKQMKSMGKIQQTPDQRAGSGASAHPSTICQSLIRNGLNSNCCPYVWKRLGERYSSECPEACVKHGGGSVTVWCRGTYHTGGIRNDNSGIVTLAGRKLVSLKSET